MPITGDTPGVVIEVMAEPEDSDPADSFATGDDAADAEMVADIRRRANAGDVWAWCYVYVRVTFRGMVGTDSLGGCSYADEKEFRAEGGYFDSMVSECLDEINAELAKRNQARPSMNGLSIDRRRAKPDDGNTIFIPLPRGAWQLCGGDGMCHCAFCSKVPGRLAYWDTMAIATEPRERPDCTWTVHRPESHPEGLRRDEITID